VVAAGVGARDDAILDVGGAAGAVVVDSCAAVDVDVGGVAALAVSATAGGPSVPQPDAVITTAPTPNSALAHRNLTYLHLRGLQLDAVTLGRRIVVPHEANGPCVA
jgi:hypothetical protein